MLRFGLIGRKISHSFSPEIHSLIGDYEYKLYPLEPEELPGFVENTDLDGFNVTIPYKRDVIPLCRTLSPRAASIGSVNTMIRLEGGGFYGDNTDYYGFSSLLGTDAESFRGKKALVLGSGGASQTVCSVLSDLNIPYVVISRSGKNNYDNLSLHLDAALIVNTTPVGMYPNNGEAPVDLRKFPSCRLVLDLIYNPFYTSLLLQAKDLGIPGRNGMLMLSAQGVKSGELFLGHKLPEELPSEIADSISRRMKNIVIIGMPGCGKTTVAAHLANLTGRQMADTDSMICEKTGMTIPEIFSEHGEAYFRKIETEVLRDVSKKSGLIISTGGGVVTVPENRDFIRQNSICLFLDRDSSSLPIEGRPLSKSIGIENLLRIRMPLYKAWSDKTFLSEDCLKTAKNIKKELRL
ncbi:MAG: shikimate kinase [Bacillota bacterium]|nr:shikimate kinase [Bacillota bacterium]